MWHEVLHALIHTLKMAPFLFLVYVLIEVIEEYSLSNIKNKHIFKSNYAVLVGTGIGVIPQCGFSVVASELYSKRKITVGTLLAIFIATSDEALPILMASPAGWSKIWPLLLIKLVFAVVVGYSVDFVVYLYNKKHKPAMVSYPSNDNMSQIKDINKDMKSNLDTITVDLDHDGHDHCHGDLDHDCHDHCHDDLDDGEINLHVKGCCGHDVEEGQPSTLKKFLYHPLIHTLKILAYILVVNIIFNLLIYYVTEERISSFLASAALLQPLASAVIGLVPNCAASVIITNLYLLNNGMTLGSCVAGLCVNAGLGVLYLFKNNKHIKENIAILSTLFVLSVLVGMLVDLIVRLI